MFGVQFYPTPLLLVSKMFSKLQDKERIRNVLDPSAGKGDILSYAKSAMTWSRPKLFAIEIDENLRSVLMGKDYRVLDSDFLLYSGAEQFDLIAMNPPFADGHKHLLKAISVMYSGQIVCILNAETIRNPNSNERFLLCQKLEELGASIDFLKDEFTTAETERKTSVEIALVYIDMRKDVDADLFAGMRSEEAKAYLARETDAIVKAGDIESLVETYEFIKQIGIQTILDYYKNYQFIAEHISLRCGSELSPNPSLQDCINDFTRDLKKSTWAKVVDLNRVRDYLTLEKAAQLREFLAKNAEMEPSRHNIDELMLSLCRGFNENIKDAVMSLFNMLTQDYAYYPEMKSNRLHFNGWKTNDAFKINKKVIIPLVYGGFDKLYASIPYEKRHALDDIDKVLCYFSGKKISDITTINNVIDEIRKVHKSYVCSSVDSTNFTISVYKKGTIHLAFKDLDLLRRFNLFACKERGWLPASYGTKPKEEMTKDEMSMAKSFESKMSEYRVIPNEAAVDAAFMQKMLTR